MSTDDNFPSALKAALDDGLLVPFRPQLSWRQQECRKIYMTKETVEWARTVLPSAKTDGFVHGALLPKEQLLALTTRFCGGQHFHPPIPHLMRPTDEGIWRIPTADLRLVGWFPVKGVFLVNEIELKANCTGLRDQQLLEAAMKRRCEFCLNDPTFSWETLDDCL